MSSLEKKFSAEVQARYETIEWVSPELEGIVAELGDDNTEGEKTEQKFIGAEAMEVETMLASREESVAAPEIRSSIRRKRLGFIGTTAIGLLLNLGAATQEAHAKNPQGWLRKVGEYAQKARQVQDNVNQHKQEQIRNQTEVYVELLEKEIVGYYKIVPSKDKKTSPEYIFRPGIEQMYHENVDKLNLEENSFRIKDELTIEREKDLRLRRLVLEDHYRSDIRNIRSRQEALRHDARVNLEELRKESEERRYFWDQVREATSPF